MTRNNETKLRLARVNELLKTLKPVDISKVVLPKEKAQKQEQVKGKEMSRLF
jgi:hypothetical protein